MSADWIADVTVNGKPVPYSVDDTGTTLIFTPGVELRNGDTMRVTLIGRNVGDTFSLSDVQP